MSMGPAQRPGTAAATKKTKRIRDMNSDVLARLYKAPPESGSARRGHESGDKQQEEVSPASNNNNHFYNSPSSEHNNNNTIIGRISPTSSARSRSHHYANNDPNYAPVFAQEYMSELRTRQHSQLESIASYLESGEHEPIGVSSRLCGKDMGGWAYGPSYSRTLQGMEPEAEVFPPSARSARRLASARSARCVFTTSGGGGKPNHQQGRNKSSSFPASRPSTAGASATMTATTTATRTPRCGAGPFRPSSAATTTTTIGVSDTDSLFTVVRDVPIPSPRAMYYVPDPNSNGAKIFGVPKKGSALYINRDFDPKPSGRPLAFEYSYNVRARPATAEQMLSKSDKAILQHQDRQRRLERQREKLRSAAPMEFRWQL